MHRNQIKTTNSLEFAQLKMQMRIAHSKRMNLLNLFWTLYLFWLLVFVFVYKLNFYPQPLQCLHGIDALLCSASILPWLWKLEFEQQQWWSVLLGNSVFMCVHCAHFFLLAVDMKSEESDICRHAVHTAIFHYFSFNKYNVVFALSLLLKNGRYRFKISRERERENTQ